MKKHPPHPAEDLLGEIPVTLEDVARWLDAVTGLPRDSIRRAYYAEYWNVPEKIRAAKRAGTFDATIAADLHRQF